jgi:hypothetical protein
MVQAIDLEIKVGGGMAEGYELWEALSSLPLLENVSVYAHNTAFVDFADECMEIFFEDMGGMDQIR